MYKMQKETMVKFLILLSFSILMALSIGTPYHAAKVSKVDQFNNQIIGNYLVHMSSDTNTLVIDRAYRDLSFDGLTNDCPDTLILPDSLEYKGVKYQVEAIGDGFIIPDNVSNLIIPEGIKSIGESF